MSTPTAEAPAPTATEPPRGRRRALVTLAVSLALSVGLVAYLLSRIELADLAQTFARIYVPSLAAYAALSLLAAGVRAWRYRLLLGAEQIGAGGIFLVTLVRNLFIDLLPAKLGALSYVYLVVRRFGVPLELGASTFILAAVFDAISLSPILLPALFVVGLGTTVVSTVQFALLATALLLGLGLLLLALPALLRLGLRIGEWVLAAAGIGGKWGVAHLLDRLRGTVEATETIRARGVYGRVLAVSVLLRLLKYGSLYFLLHALLLNQGFPLAALSFWKVVLGIAGAELSSNLPIQGVAGLGTWETAFALAFRLMGYPERIAIVAGFGLHLITQVYEYSLGVLAILALAVAPVGWRRRHR